MVNLHLPLILHELGLGVPLAKTQWLHIFVKFHFSLCFISTIQFLSHGYITYSHFLVHLLSSLNPLFTFVFFLLGQITLTYTIYIFMVIYNCTFKICYRILHMMCPGLSHLIKYIFFCSYLYYFVLHFTMYDISIDNNDM